MGITNMSRLITVAFGLGFFALTPARALAHCDGLDGPVVKAAQRALETRNPALLLIWVQEKDEPESGGFLGLGMLVILVAPRVLAARLGLIQDGRRTP